VGYSDELFARKLQHSGIAPTPSPDPVFPLSADAGGRYLKQNDGTPFPILGRTSWAIVSLSAANYRAYIDDTAERGYNTIECAIPHHWPTTNQPPFGGDGTLLPFTHRLDGSDYAGSLTYSNINNEAADFTTLSEPYWSFVDALLDYARGKGILVLLFLCYNGSVDTQGWMAEMVANGATKMQAYGAALGARWAAKTNIVWMLAGDFGGPSAPYSGPQDTVESAFVTGLTGVTKVCNFYSAELSDESSSSDASTTNLQAAINLNGGYSHGGASAFWCRHAWDANQGPSFLLEAIYDEEGPDGSDENSNATQPVRRANWWGWLKSIGGHVLGNGYVWKFLPSGTPPGTDNYASHLNTASTQQMTLMAAFIKSIEWWRLVPSETVVTSGGGNITDVPAADYVPAAYTSLGDLLVAYMPTGWGGSTGIDMTVMRGTATAQWFDPSDGTYHSIGSIANTGSHTFTSPGNNAAGQADWVLRLDA